MNRNNRHMRYRRSIYRKKRIKTVVITVVCAVLLTVVLFTIIGNALGDKVEERLERSNGKVTDTADAAHATVRSVNAYPVPLSANDSKLSTRLSRAAANGYKEICFELDTENGTLLYSSDIAVQLGKQGSGLELWQLDDAMKLFDENGLYSIGITHVSDLSSEDDLARSAGTGYHAALIAEALRAGVDDVLVYVGELPAEQYDELIALAESIHRLCPEGRIGLSLPLGILSGSDNSELMDKLWNAFDYLAADLTDPAVDGDDAAERIDTALGSMLYYLLRYNMRVLVPYTDDSELAAAISAAVSTNGGQSIQIMP